MRAATRRPGARAAEAAGAEAAGTGEAGPSGALAAPAPAASGLRTLALEHHDLLAALLLPALLFALLAFLPAVHAAVGLGLGLLVVLFLPGHAVASALFPARADLAFHERVLLAAALSIAAVVLAGLGLHYTGAGIGPSSSAGVLAATSAAASLVALGRRALLPGEARSRATDLLPPRSAAALLLGALLLPLAPLLWPDRDLTELYLLGPDGRLDGFERRVEAGGALPIGVGVVNGAGGDRAFRLRLRYEPAGPAAAPPAALPAAPERTLGPLAPGHEERLELSLPAPAEPGVYRLVVELARRPGGEAFRRVALEGIEVRP